MSQVHIEWARAPFAEHSWYTGKEGYPTVVFEVTVDHTRKILSASMGFPGSINDRTISGIDTIMRNVR